MHVWAIRQKSTGHYLPARKGRGFSHDEPQPKERGLGPRLFFSEHAAKMALVAWCSGKWVRTFHSDWYEGTDDAIDIKPQSHRKREDMEIVRFALTEDE